MKKIILSGLLAAACAASFALSGKDVVQKYFDTNPAPSFSKTLFICDSFKGGKLDDSVTVEQCGRHRNGLTETVFEIVKNPSLKGTRFLQSQKKGDDARFIYAPALRTVRRIPVQDKSKQFVGSEYTYNDTSLRDIDEDDHELIDEKALVRIDSASYTCWAVKSTPHSKREVEYDYRIAYYDQNTVMPVKTEYFDRTGKLVKTMEIKKLVSIKGKMGKSHWCRQVCEIVNKRTGRSSVITVKSQILDDSALVKDGYFNQNWLSTGKL
ncbi:MAG: outer membrane lipoprotein-sorting protein [Treponema sp.]|nr:outer membrane lipoprotein-sorting protein [Treponema sp.]